MYNVVKIGDKDVPMLAMASVDVYYRNIFREDPIALQARGMDEGSAIAFYQKMGFVMAKFAELKAPQEMRKLNEDSYLEWLDGLQRNDYISALPLVQATYDGQQISSSDAKKKEEEPNE